MNEDARMMTVWETVKKAWRDFWDSTIRPSMIDDGPVSSPEDDLFVPVRGYSEEGHAERGKLCFHQAAQSDRAPQRFRKKPVVIEAMPWTGTNFDEITAWAGGATLFVKAAPSQLLFINTLEGVMEANAGDWIIRGIKGELYPCKPDVFTLSYEPMEGP
jgi:hypothetical protein